MTYHFVNLVSWKFFLTELRPDQLIYVDSCSLQWALRWFCGFSVQRNSGVDFVRSGILNNEGDTFLLSSEDPRRDLQYVLPWMKLESIEIPQSLLSFIEKDKGGRIVIGISSPKQDLLAIRLSEIFPSRDIFCLGAALDYEVKGSFCRFPTFIEMFFRQPRRTIGKLLVTFRCLGKLCFSRPYREEFREFAIIISKNI